MIDKEIFLLLTTNYCLLTTFDFIQLHSYNFDKLNIKRLTSENYCFILILPKINQIKEVYNEFTTFG
jgi:hypothetical protein